MLPIHFPRKKLRFLTNMRLFFCLILCTVSGQPGRAAERLEITVGEALDAGGNRVYREVSQFTFEGTRPKKSSHQYFDEAGTQIGLVTADFSKSIYVPDFEVNDLRHKHIYRLTLNEDGHSAKVWVHHHPNKEKSTTVAVNPEQTVAGPGCFYYARDSFSKITDGKSLHVRVISPAQQDDFPFRLKLFEKNEKHFGVSLAYDQFFIRLFAPEVSFYFAPDGMSLVAYKGPPIIADAKGSFRTIDLRYRKQ